MKSETSFRVFFLKQHRKNGLKNIFFPSESVFLDFSFWPQGHRTWQNAHCAMVDNVASLVSLGEVYNRFGGRQLWCRWLYELHGGGLQENNGCRWMGGWRSDSYAAGDCLDPGMPAPQPPPRPGRPRDPPPTPKTHFHPPPPLVTCSGKHTWLSGIKYYAAKYFGSRCFCSFQ